MERIGKKGVSTVVVTVSMILVAIVAVGIITAFVVPMIKGQLGKASACLELNDHFIVRTESSATCYNSTSVKLSIKRGWEKEECEGFVVTAFTKAGGASSLEQKDIDAELSRGGAKVFVLDTDGAIERVSIATVLIDGAVCDPIDYTGIGPC